jgi:polar amino acid transport system ATP-binding protein
MGSQLTHFDEAISALGPERIGEGLDLLKTFAREAMTIVVVTSAIGFAVEVVVRKIYMGW